MVSILRSVAHKVGLGRAMRAWRRTLRRRALPKRDNFDALLNFARPRSPPGYLSIAAKFRDEAHHLAEWLEFHHLVGVEHVYLYDNGSTDNPCKVLEPYIREGFVSVIPWASPLTAHEVLQRFAYVHAILNFGIHWRWMAFIDIDEFLFPVEGTSLPAILADYEGLPAVAAYWTMYGFNGHETRPPGLTIESYTKRSPYGVQAWPKSIVDPSKVIGVGSVHMFDFAEGREIAYDEQKRLIRGLEGKKGRPPSDFGPSNILRLNHYFTRSREEFAAKTARYSQIEAKKSDQKRKFARMLEENGAFYDDTILRFVPEVKLRLGARAGHNLWKSEAQAGRS